MVKELHSGITFFEFPEDNNLKKVYILGAIE